MRIEFKKSCPKLKHRLEECLFYAFIVVFVVGMTVYLLGMEIG